MRKGFLRSAVSLLLLVSFAPSLLYCGEVNLAPMMVRLAVKPGPKDGELPPPAPPLGQYVPIVPPGAIADFLSQATDQTTYLGDLPIDQVMARDLINKLLSAFLVNFQDEIATLLKSFGINLPANWQTIPLNYLLSLIHLKSYDETLANTLLKQWSGELTPQQQETLKRFWMAQMVVRTGFDSSLAMAEDATEGLYDLIDLIYGATHVLKHLSDHFENIPVVGAIIRKIRLMISERIIFALNNAVDLLTSKMKEPARSRVRGIFTALCTTYIKWAGIQVGSGFGGISPELLEKIGAKLLGKFLLLLPPKIGYVSLTGDPAKYAAEHALSMSYTGTFAQAASQVLDDGNDSTENAVCESMMKTVLRKQELSLHERQIANVAGAISQIAELIHFVDPTSFARIVYIGAAILAGGLQLHTVFNSGITLYKLPARVDTGVRLAFDPAAVPPSGGTTSVVADKPDLFHASNQYVEFLGTRLKATDAQFARSMTALQDAVSGTDMGQIDAALDTVETASMAVRHDVKLLSSFVVPSDGGPEEMKSLFGSGMMDHDLKSAGVYSDVLAYVFRPTASARPALLEKIRDLKKSTSDFLASVQQIASSGQMEKGPALAAVAPSAVFATERFELAASVISVGTHAATHVRVQLALPQGYTLESGDQATTSAELAPGQELPLKWTVKRPAGEFKRAMIVLNVLSDDAPEVNHSVLVTE